MNFLERFANTAILRNALGAIAMCILCGCNIQGNESKLDTDFRPGLSTQNTAPVATARSISTNTNTPVSSTLLASDANSDNLVYSLVTQPAKGVVTVTNTATGAFTYTPNSGEAGADSFTFKVNDGKVDSNTATVSVTIGVVAFTDSWPFTALTTALYTFNAAVIQFTSGVAELIGMDQTDDDNTSTGFDPTTTGGSLTGVIYGTLADGSTQGLKLGSNGGCDGSASDCAKQDATEIYELNSSWTPQWGSLVSYWKMENNWNDSKGSNNGTASGATFTSSKKIGTYAGAFSGTAQLVSIPNQANLNISASISIAAWVKNAASDTAYHYIISKKANDDYQGYGLHISNTGRAAIEIDGNNPSFTLSTGTTDLRDNNWHYLVGTYDGNTAKIYVDGILENSTNYSGGFTTNTNPLHFSSGIGGAYMFNGSLDEAAIWSTDLSVTEIQTIYERQKSAYSGTFNSRIMDAGSSSSWTTLSWLPTLPFFKELPDFSGSVQNEISTDYSSLQGDTPATGDNNLMTGIVGLWHLNEASGTSTVGSVIDRSTTTSPNNGTPSNVTFGATGMLGFAASFNGTSSYIDFGTSSSLKPTNAITVSSWIYFNSVAANSGSSYTRILSDWHQDPSTDRWLFYLSSDGTLNWHVSNLNESNTADATTSVVSGIWYHIVGTYDGSKIAIYLNGNQIGSTSPLSGAMNTNSLSVRMGKQAETGAYFNGSFDEVAIWNKALNINEIKQLYQRGASRLKYQVRTCNDSACAGETWQGPDGTSATYFSELNNNTAPLAMTGDVKATLPSMLFSNFTSPPSANRYFQYRTIFETDSSTVALGPELKSVTIDPQHYPSYLSTDTSPGNTIIGNNGVAFYDLNDFVQTLGSGGCSSGVVYNLGLSSTGPWKYWTGAAWATSNGSSAQANTAAALVASSSAALNAFGTGVGRGSIYFKAFMNSSGTSKCELDNITVGGNR